MDLVIQELCFLTLSKSLKLVLPPYFGCQTERHRNHHLVYVPGLTTSDIIETFNDGFEIDHVNFLMHETDNTIELVTAYMFTPQACKELLLKTINRFDLQTLEWENAIYYPNKYENFYGCELTVAENDESDNVFQKEIQELFQIIFVDQLNAILKLSPLSYKECDLSQLDASIIHTQYE